MLKLLAATVSAGILALSLSTSAGAATITSFSDGFEAEVGGTYPALPFANWDVTGGSVDVLKDPFHGGLCGLAGGLQNCVDLDGSSLAAGTLTTKDDFLAGEYLVSFDLAGNQRSGSDRVEVNFGSLLIGTFDLDFEDGFTTISQIVTLTSLGKLSFSNAGGDNIGALLDNVSISAVPVPAALPLFGTGLVIMGFMGWRRKRKAA